MYLNQQTPSIKIDKKELQKLKNLVMIFALSRFAILFEYDQGRNFFAIGITFGSILIDYCGIICLAVGIYRIATNDAKLIKGKKVAYLFAFSVIISLVRLVLAFFRPIFSFQTQLYNIDVSKMNTIISLAFIVIIGVITFITAKNFTDWFNYYFCRPYPTKS